MSYNTVWFMLSKNRAASTTRGNKYHKEVLNAKEDIINRHDFISIIIEHEQVNSSLPNSGQYFNY